MIKSFYAKICRIHLTTPKPSADFECISQFSETSKNIKIVQFVLHFPYIVSQFAKKDQEGKVKV